MRCDAIREEGQNGVVWREGRDTCEGVRRTCWSVMPRGQGDDVGGVYNSLRCFHFHVTTHLCMTLVGPTFSLFSVSTRQRVRDCYFFFFFFFLSRRVNKMSCDIRTSKIYKCPTNILH